MPRSTGALRPQASTSPRGPCLGLVLALLAAGCGGGGAASPDEALSEMARALERRDWDTAYALMSAGYRGRVSLDAFRAHLERHPDEVREVAAALAAPHGPAEQTARVAYGDGEELLLRRVDGRWRIQGNVVQFYDQSTPRAALRTFVRAVDRGRYDVVLRLVPDADRPGMSADRIRETFEGEGREDLDRMVTLLREHLDDPIEIVGDRATMPYGDRFTAQLVRERGVWKIEDPE